MKLLLGLMLLVASMNTFAACTSAAECKTKADCDAFNAGKTPAAVSWSGDACVVVAATEPSNSNCTAISGLAGPKSSEDASKKGGTDSGAVAK